jgi:hypothetical protein
VISQEMNLSFLELIPCRGFFGCLHQKNNLKRGSLIVIELFQLVMTLEGRKPKRATCSHRSNPLVRMADSRVDQNPKGGSISGSRAAYRL